MSESEEGERQMLPTVTEYGAAHPKSIDYNFKL